MAFWDKDHLIAGEDRGDGLHTQHNALDSIFWFDANANCGRAGTRPPVRIVALGRDASATIDAALLSISGNGFQNDGDNETTGLHVSDGDPSPGGILGAKTPRPFSHGWRVFYTQQHGDNVTWELHPVDGDRMTFAEVIRASAGTPSQAHTATRRHPRVAAVPRPTHDAERVLSLRLMCRRCARYHWPIRGVPSHALTL